MNELYNKLINNGVSEKSAYNFCDIVKDIYTSVDRLQIEKGEDSMFFQYNSPSFKQQCHLRVNRNGECNFSGIAFDNQPRLSAGKYVTDGEHLCTSYVIDNNGEFVICTFKSMDDNKSLFDREDAVNILTNGEDNKGIKHYYYDSTKVGILASRKDQKYDDSSTIFPESFNKFGIEPTKYEEVNIDNFNPYSTISYLLNNHSIDEIEFNDSSRLHM